MKEEKEKVKRTRTKKVQEVQEVQENNELNNNILADILDNKPEDIKRVETETETTEKPAELEEVEETTETEVEDTEINPVDPKFINVLAKATTGIYNKLTPTAYNLFFTEKLKNKTLFDIKEEKDDLTIIQSCFAVIFKNAMRKLELNQESEISIAVITIIGVTAAKLAVSEKIETIEIDDSQTGILKQATKRSHKKKINLNDE